MTVPADEAVILAVKLTVSVVPQETNGSVLEALIVTAETLNGVVVAVCDPDDWLADEDGEELVEFPVEVRVAVLVAVFETNALMVELAVGDGSSSEGSTIGAVSVSADADEFCLFLMIKNINAIRTRMAIIIRIIVLLVSAGRFLESCTLSISPLFVLST